MDNLVLFDIQYQHAVIVLFLIRQLKIGLFITSCSHLKCPCNCYNVRVIWGFYVHTCVYCITAVMSKERYSFFPHFSGVQHSEFCSPSVSSSLSPPIWTWRSILRYFVGDYRPSRQSTLGVRSTAGGQGDLEMWTLRGGETCEDKGH